jgi:hypothetical protein
MYIMAQGSSFQAFVRNPWSDIEPCTAATQERSFPLVAG